jgi:hypothetical protein
MRHLEHYGGILTIFVYESYLNSLKILTVLKAYRDESSWKREAEAMCRGSFLIDLNGHWISVGKKLAFVLKGYQKQQEDLFPSSGAYQTPSWHSWKLRSNLQLGLGGTCSSGERWPAATTSQHLSAIVNVK